MRRLREFVGFILRFPGKVIYGLRYFIWPKQSRRRYRTALVAILLVTFLFALIDYPKYWDKFADFINPKLDAINMPDSIRKLDIPHFWDIPFSLGLDLRGGIHLIYRAELSQVDSSERGAAMQGLRDVIERRVNLFGVREPQVLVQETGGEYRLLVELAGVEDFQTAISLIGQTPYLEFKEEQSLEVQKRILRKAIEDQAKLSDEDILSVCANINPQFLYLVQQSQGEDPCFTSFTPPLTGKYLESASLGFDANTNQPIVSLELNEEGAKIFEQATERNIGKPLAIYLDRILINWPRVQEKIAGGMAQITGFNIQEAKELARNLNAGALPVPITLISQQSIGASLGEESLKASLRAGIAGFLAVILYMITLYRVSGLLAAVALFVYLVLLLAIFKLLPVTLTLPGIAGFILSLGMAVDANILVFERLREEISYGTPFPLALNHAFGRAWSAIRDGNITTILTCVILFWFSTSFIKGFALTLGIGVALSMFSAMIVTRYIMRLAGEGRLGKKTWLWIR